MVMLFGACGVAVPDVYMNSVGDRMSPCGTPVFTSFFLNVM